MSSTTEGPTGHPAAREHDPRKACKALIGAYVGTSPEWYDFFLFGATASIVFAPLFFGGEDPALAVLRFLQGMAVGDEWGGATLLAVENAPEHKRGFSSAVVQLGSPTGTILSSMIVAAVVALADKTSPSIVEAVGYAIAALEAFPIFWLVDTRGTALIAVAMILGLGFASIPYAPVCTVLTQLFPVKVRYSAIARARTPEGAPVVDAGGRYLMPGFIESHGPPGIYVCLAMKADCRPSVTPRASDVVKAIREAAQEAEAGEWVRGWATTST